MRRLVVARESAPAEPRFVARIALVRVVARARAQLELCKVGVRRRRGAVESRRVTWPVGVADAVRVGAALERTLGARHGGVEFVWGSVLVLGRGSIWEGGWNVVESEGFCNLDWVLKRWAFWRAGDAVLCCHK